METKQIEREIRKELDNLTTYKIGNSQTDLVPLVSVKRILNLVFRGCRDKEPNFYVEVYCKSVIDYLETYYVGARAMDDVEECVRIARAIEAYNTEP